MTLKDLCYGMKHLRNRCFVVGYLNLFASVVDLSCHLVILSTVTNFFSCDVDLASVHNINWTWLEPFLIIINIGTHGFYPFPLILNYYDSLGVPGVHRCYPGMLHIYLMDLINILVHVVWLKVVVSYVTALHEKDPEPMRMFFSLSVIKIILQVLYFAYQPFFFSEIILVTYWFVKLVDIMVAVVFLILIYGYIKALREKKSALAPVVVDHPPSYIECLMNGSPSTSTTDKAPQIVVTTEQKTVV